MNNNHNHGSIICNDCGLSVFESHSIIKLGENCIANRIWALSGRLQNYVAKQFRLNNRQIVLKTYDFDAGALLINMQLSCNFNFNLKLYTLIFTINSFNCNVTQHIWWIIFINSRRTFILAWNFSNCIHSSKSQINHFTKHVQ